MAVVKFYSGTYDQFKAAVKNDDSLYFITDTFQLYKGANLYTKNFKVVNSLGEIGSDSIPKLEGVLYVTKDTHQFAVVEGDVVIELTPPVSATAPAENSGNLITSGAVYTAIKTLEAVDTGIKDRLSVVEELVGVDGGEGEGSSLGEQITAIKSDIAGLKTADTTLQEAVDAIEADYLPKAGGTLTGSLTLAGDPTKDNEAANKKYVDAQVSTKVAEVIGGAPETYDTLKEIADWIAADEEGAAALTQEINTLKTGKVDKVEGKGLSTNDFDNTAKGKLDGIAAGAQVNVLESVKVNNTPLDISEKGVNIVIQGGTTNGTIIVNGVEVKVTGLAGAAYQETSAFATAAQGAKADTALQKADISSGSSNGAINVGGSNIMVYGLKSAAYQDSSAFIAASKLGSISGATIADSISTAASAAQTAAENAADTKIQNALTWINIS